MRAAFLTFFVSFWIWHRRKSTTQRHTNKHRLTMTQTAVTRWTACKMPAVQCYMQFGALQDGSSHSMYYFYRSSISPCKHTQRKIPLNVKNSSGIHMKVYDIPLSQSKSNKSQYSDYHWLRMWRHITLWSTRLTSGRVFKFVQMCLESVLCSLYGVCCCSW